MEQPKKPLFEQDKLTTEDFKEHAGSLQEISVLFRGGIDNGFLLVTGVVQSVDEKVVIFSQGNLIMKLDASGKTSLDLPVKNLPVPIKQIFRKFRTTGGLAAFFIETLLKKFGK